MVLKDLQFLNANSAIVSIVAVLMLNTIGISYSFGIFGSLGLSYFDFANTSDFLLAAFKSPIVFLVSLSLILLAVKTINKLVKQENSDDASDLKYFGYILIVFSYLVFIPATFGYLNAKIANVHNTENKEFNTFVSMFIGQFPKIKMFCELYENGNRSVQEIGGTLVGEAGDIYLVKSASTGAPDATLVAKSCVKLIETDYPIASEHSNSS